MIVYTGAERNAGTSSDVTIRLIGNHGTTEPHILKSKSDCQNDFLSDKVRAPRMQPHVDRLVNASETHRKGWLGKKYSKILFAGD